MSDVYNNNEEVVFEAQTMMRPRSVLGLVMTVTVVPVFTRFLTKKSSRFTLTNERLIVSKGIIGKSIDEIELYRIKDSRVKQSFFQRIMGTGDIFVSSTDVSGSFLMNNVSAPKKKRDQIRKMVNESRKSKNVRIHTS